MTFLELFKGVVGDGLHDLDTSLDGESVDDPDLRLSCLELVFEEELHDLLSGCADVRTDSVSSANSDDELVELGVVDGRSLFLELLHSVELLLEENSELLLRCFDCLLVNHLFSPSG